MSDDPDLVEADQKIAASGVKRGQRYRHFKTGFIYIIDSVGVFEPDFSPMVGYQRDVGGRIWYRSLAVFTSRAIYGNVLVPRFVLVEDASAT